jgi:hypothetical protein
MLRQHLRNRRRQRRLAMVNVTNRPYVAVRLIPIKFLFRHFSFLCGAGQTGFGSAGVPPAEIYKSHAMRISSCESSIANQ